MSIVWWRTRRTRVYICISSIFSPTNGASREDPRSTICRHETHSKAAISGHYSLSIILTIMPIDRSHISFRKTGCCGGEGVFVKRGRVLPSANSLSIIASAVSPANYLLYLYQVHRCEIYTPIGLLIDSNSNRCCHLHHHSRFIRSWPLLRTVLLRS